VLNPKKINYLGALLLLHKTILLLKLAYMTRDEKSAALELISKQVKICEKCRLCKTAINGVPGEGNPDSEIIFVGEAPGANEDQQGRPFVGRAGKLLEFLLSQIGYKREEVWIGNIVKHRPPENRDPLPDEIEACKPYLTNQIEIISPKLIITLGRFSMNYFLPDAKISQEHGKATNLGKFYLYPVYHPAAGLRNPSMKNELIKDFLKIPDVLKEISLKKSHIAEEKSETSKPFQPPESTKDKYPSSEYGQVKLI
jgi:uracil-DNA glycosylase family 4